MNLTKFMSFVERGFIYLVLQKYNPHIKREYTIKFIEMINQIVKKSEGTMIE